MAWVCNIASVVTITILHLRISLCILILPYPTFICQSLFIIPSFICLPSFIFSTFLGLLFGRWHKDASSDSYSIYDLARLVRVEMVDEFWCYFAICFHDTRRCCHCCEGQPLCKSICNVFAHDAVKDRRGWPRFQIWIEFWIEQAVPVLGRLICQQQNSNGLFWFWWDLAMEREVDAPVITWFDKCYFMWEYVRIICVECCDRKAVLMHVCRKCPMSLRPGWVWHEMWHTCGAWEGHASFDDRSM